MPFGFITEKRPTGVLEDRSYKTLLKATLILPLSGTI
jgi:hypothetical protein